MCVREFLGPEREGNSKLISVISVNSVCVCAFPLYTHTLEPLAQLYFGELIVGKIK